METCYVCDSKSFELVAGFYYCSVCSTQAKKVELQHDTYFGHLDNRLNKSKQIVNKSQEVLEITSWEEYNYILVGLVDELIELGAKPELKLTALQMWTSYLRQHEVAFFAKKDPKLPKLGAFFKKKDARIIYGLKARRSPRSISVTTGKSSVVSSKGTKSSKSLKMARRKQQISLVNAEYDTYQTDLETTIGSLSVNNLSASSFSTKASTGSENSVRIEFSRMARRSLKRKIPKKHLQKHELDGSLPCHNFKRSNNLQHCYPEIVTRSVLYEIVYLALNQIEDDIQLGDMIRYLREGHLPFYNIAKFIPSNVASVKSADRTFNKAKNLFPSHTHVRLLAVKHMRLLKVHMKVPDMSKLCRRYITELCLPNDLHKMVDTMLMVCPPEMKLKNRVVDRVANYEGRAMAYIIFVLKLLFGLDNTREMRISESAKNINSTIAEVGLNKEQLFVWSEWVKFIEMRNVILAQCHYPTSLQLDPRATQYPHLYVHYLKEQEEKEDQNNEDKAKSHLCIENLDTVFKKLCKLHETENEKPSFKFLPSLTPKSYCMNYLLSDHTMTESIHIPGFMKQTFENADILSFLRPSLLRSYFHENGLNLTVHRLECNDNINFTDFFSRFYPNKETPYKYSSANHLLRYKFNVTDEQWRENFKHEENLKQEIDAKKSEEQGALIASHLAFIDDRNEKALAAKKLRKARIKNDNNAENDILNEPAIEFNQQDEHCIPLFDYDVSDDEDNDNDNVDMDDDNDGTGLRFNVSNYDYWMNLGYTDDLSRDQFNLLQTKLPKHFNWLLEQCSNTIECHVRDVYTELLLIENQFAYVIEDFSKMSNIVLKQDPERYRQLSGMYKFIRFMQKRW